MYKVVGVYMDNETGELVNLEMKFKHETAFFRLVGQVSRESTMWFSESMMERYLESGNVTKVENYGERFYDSEEALIVGMKNYAVDMKEKGVQDLFLFPCFCTSLARGEIYTTLDVQKVMELAVKILITELGRETVGSV